MQRRSKDVKEWHDKASNLSFDSKGREIFREQENKKFGILRQ